MKNYNIKTSKRVWFVFALFGIMASSCSNPDAASTEQYVVCTTNIIADVAKNLLPEEVQVISLMGAGVDPHLYKAGQKDLEYLQKAKVVVENGLHLEGKMAEVMSKLSRYKTVVKMSDGVSEQQLIRVSKEVYDPHIWFDVELWKGATTHLSEKLTEAYPEYKEEIEQNAKTYIQTLSLLNAEVKKLTASIPKDKRILATAHDAFSYFGQKYGLEVRGLQGISTQSEFGLKDVSDLVKFLVDREIPAVFVETSVSEKSIRSVVEGCQKKNHQIVIGGKLYSDALGGANEAGNTYVNMVRSNVNTIVNALNEPNYE